MSPLRRDILTIETALSSAPAHDALRRVVAVLKARMGRYRLAESRLRKAETLLVDIHDRLGEVMAEEDHAPFLPATTERNFVVSNATTPENQNRNEGTK